MQTSQHLKFKNCKYCGTCFVGDNKEKVCDYCIMKIQFSSVSMALSSCSLIIQWILPNSYDITPIGITFLICQFSLMLGMRSPQQNKAICFCGEIGRHSKAAHEMMMLHKT